MFLSKVSIKRPVLMTMVIMSFVVIGLYSYFQLAVDLTPDVDFPVVTITTVYPGAGPKEIETLIIEKIEDEVSTISGVKHVQAVAREGVAIMIVEFEVGTDVDIVAIEVKDKIDLIKSDLPDDAEDPVVSKFDINAQPVLDLAVSSPRPLAEVYRLVDDVIKDRLSRVPGVASIDIFGGKEREILISVRRDRLRAYGLSILDVVGSIAASNLDIPGGHIKQGTKEYTVRLDGEFDEVDQIRKVRLASFSNPNPIKLTEVADVIDSFEEQRDLARYESKPAVGLSVVKKGDANSVQVAKGVKKEIARLADVLPGDVRIEVARDRSVFIERSINDVMSNLFIGILLTALVLYLFLHNIQGTIIAAIAMPTSIIATFTLILFAGFTLNFMSLMGLAISVGILVANSIVVLENIIHRIQMGEKPVTAADVGTAEIALAVVASTLTNIVVFTPIAFMSGIVGQFFRQFGLTVAFATIFSLIVSFTLTPMLAAKLLKQQNDHEEQKRGPLYRFGQWWDALYEDLATGYKSALNWALRHRPPVMVLNTAIFLASLFLMRFIGSEFFTPSDEGQIDVTLEMPAGTRLEQTDKSLRRVEQTLSKIPEVKSIYTILGRIDAGGLAASTEGVEVGQMAVKLVDKDKRERATKEVAKEMLSKLAVIPAADITVKPTNPFGGAQADLQIELTGDDMNVLNDLAGQLMNIVRKTKGTTSVKSSWKVGKPEIKIIPDRDRIAEHGLTVGQVASAVRASIEGQVASEYRVGDHEYDMRVRFADADKNNIDQVRDILLRGADGQVIPIAEVADIELGAGPTQISRKDKKRLVTVTANIAQRSLGEVQADIEAQLQQLHLPPGYGVFFGGQSERQAESFANILQALLLAIILTYMALAAILESYIHPITIMMTLPLGLVGVILSLLITGATLSIFSMMAMVMLVGIVVNNGILLLDYTHVLRERGMEIMEAIVKACSERLRPIIMMNLAVALGMLPLALGLGEGSETRAPMAIVSIGGIMTSTIFTVFLIPVIYLTFEKIKMRFAKVETE
ncbi:MAG: efflux RND transporter permease subunit, partial [bacterium]